jgi:hypothetical protein
VAEPALEHRDPFRRLEPTPDGGGLLDPGGRHHVRRHGEKCRQIRISARNGAIVESSSSLPASCARVLDHGQSSARLTNPATTGLSAM